jgi:uncharacterized protein YcbX
MSLSVSALKLYPVKSCRGIAAERARLTERGLAHDREWMIVEADGDPALFVTQREIPRLALIETRVTADSLVLEGPGMTALQVGFDAPERTDARRRVVVWRDTVAAIDQGDAAARWLSSFAGTPLRLVRFDRAFRRLCNPQFAGDTGAHTGFADGYPLLVIGAESLRDLNRRLAGNGSPALPMNRFRPNLVLEGLEAYDEDHLASLTIGDAQLRLVKPCVRCQITTTDQATAEVGHEPLRTLAGYRHNPRLGGVTFGINAIVTRGAGTVLEVGSAAEADWAF